MSDRIYASVFYIVLIVSSSWAVVTVTEALAREALTRMALIPSADQRPSRVNVVLAAQERPVSPQTSGAALVPAAPSPSVPVGTLAKALDDAEQSNEQTQSTPTLARPRVAGWVKRLPKAWVPTARDESSGRIVMRSLRAEM
jgi:hypothetical protein